MARIRNIQPEFGQSLSMGRVSREARLMFVLLWTIVDDEGRTRNILDDLAASLYPSDFDAAQCIPLWLDELEREGCIERYVVDDFDYLRVAQWHRHQYIDHPSPSHLPPSPNEQARVSRTRENLRRRGMPRHIATASQALSVGSSGVRENFAEERDETPVTRESLLRDLRRIGRNAEADGSHASALRSVEAIARIALTSVKKTPTEEDDMSPSPAVVRGLPITGSGR